MFKDKVVIITGASSGIGLATAREFAKERSKVVIAARREERLHEFEREFAPVTEVFSVKCDVTKESDCKNLIDKTLERFGQIDILVNNAGISMRALFVDLDLSVVKQVMDVNFWGAVYCTKYALPHILKRQGSIVGVISVSGYKGLPARTGYSASKFALYGFLETLHIEHLKDNLHIMIFAPGFTASNIREQALVADGSRQGKTPRDESKMMSAEKCAKCMLRGIRKRKVEMVLTPTGKTLVLVNKIFPRLVDWLEYRAMKKEPDSPLR